MRLPRVSFVIPVRDDAARLRRCLESLARSRYPADRLEVVVADNGSLDESRDVAARSGARVLSLPGLRVSELRNRAAAIATGEILAFVDADHEIASDWVSIAVQNLTEPGVGAVGAMCHPPQDPTWVQRLYDALRGHSTERREVLWLGSGNMAMPRDVFVRVKGFDTTLETCEDVDLCRRLRAHGVRLMSDPRLWNVHHGDPHTLRALLLGECWRGRDNLRVSLRPPLSWSILTSLLVPVATLLGLALVVVGLAGAVGLDARAGLLLAGTGVAIVTVAAVVRTGRMLHNLAHPRVPDVLRAPAVALCYELGRALAPVVRMTHGRRRLARAPGWQGTSA